MIGWIMNHSDQKQSYTVSVVIPAYNAQDYIGRAIDSVLAQTLPPDEIIVVDDGSTDNTARVVKSYGSKVRYIHQENAGASVARNAGIDAAAGPWIAFLDSDDEWLPEKLRLQTELLKRNPDLTWAGGNYYTRDMQNHRLDRITVDQLKCRKHLGDTEQVNYFSAYVDGLCILTSTAIINKSVFEQVGNFRVGQKWAQDTDLFWRIAYQLPDVGFVADPIANYYHGVPGSITQENWGKIVQRCELIERHMKLAETAGKAQQFRAIAGKLLERWTRDLIRNKRFEDINELIDRLGELFPSRLTKEMKLRVKSPLLAGICIDLYFKIKNFIGGAKAR